MEYRYQHEISIRAGNVTVHGDLIIPVKADTVIVFVHGSGSSRFSKRNREVAAYLQKNNFGTLLFDLLTVEEDLYYYNRFDIDMLTKRLVDVTGWLESFPETKDCRIAYYGASTGAASALQAASILPQIHAIVSRGGRPDLAMDVLHKVSAPTLLIVGRLDVDVLELNKKAFTALACEKKIAIVAGASHLFEEPGKMEIVSAMASEWFKIHVQVAHV